MATSYGPLSVWAVIVAGGLATFAIRLSFIHLFGRVDEVPGWLERALVYVPAAVLAALVVPDFTPAGATIGALVSPEIVGGAAAVAAAWQTEDVLWTVAAGMAGLHLARFLL
ncbi:AzlD domain-containing protein [Halobaculum gomorrense]|uniref:Branched-chain amino acid transport protein n=1 Tax=Halobaculum gomorrense TaxID=43928 RepID=A0A1M5MB99_9EURY|nr:AzlD domain-containing protein [Halobaculum gomorrense]SHG74179.1 Branched-chain amino acid transport protein [Halobaculum gomorrense]